MRFATCLVLSVILLVRAGAEQLVVVSLNKDQKIAVYELDPDAGKLALRSTLKVEGKPGAMCLNPAGDKLYVAMKGSGSIATFRIAKDATLDRVGEVKVGADASFLSFHPSGKVPVQRLLPRRADRAPSCRGRRPAPPETQ